MAISFYGLMKEFASCFMLKDGTYRAQPKGVWGKRNINQSQYEFIIAMLDLTLKTKCTREETKWYIMNEYASMKDAMEWCHERGDNVNFDAIRNRMTQDRMKVLKKLPLESFKKLFYSSELMYKEKDIVDALIMEYAEHKDMCAGTVLDLETTNVRKSLPQEEFDQFVMSIAPYTLTNIESVNKSIPKAQLEYFNYLNRALRLDGVDKERYELLRVMLGSNEKAIIKKPLEHEKEVRDVQYFRDRMPNIVI